MLGVESFILALLMLVLIVAEFRHPESLILSGDEQYIRIKAKSSDGQTMVMSGLVDMDESTLIRSKVVDDDYEVQLRKRALASILSQVGKNYFSAQQKGLDLGGQLDQCMSKFDEDQIKRRRAFSLEDICEQNEEWAEEDEQRRRYSFELSPRSRQSVPDLQFKQQIHEIKKVATRNYIVDNVYADCKPPEVNKNAVRKKTVSRRTQTYLRELLQHEGENDMRDSDLEIVLEDEAELDQDFTTNLIDTVLDGISETESNATGTAKRKRKKKVLNVKRQREIPDFELADIMGDFEIDDLGNFIILRGEKGELLDKRERRVNRRGYMIDRFGNIVNKNGQIIFKAVELDDDDEIPAPFGFEKRKKNLLNMGEGSEFKVDDQKQVLDDEDLIDGEVKKIKRKKNGVEGIEEQGDEESSIDSLMAESPGKY